MFYSPNKHDIPPPAWSPTGVLQPLPFVSSEDIFNTSFDDSNEIPLDVLAEASGDDSVEESTETSIDASAETSVDESANGSIDDLPDNDLNDLPDITMSLPTRKKRMTVVVEVPHVSEVLKRWTSDSTVRSVSATSTSILSPFCVELSLIFSCSTSKGEDRATRACT